MLAKHSILKELLQTFRDIEREKDKVLKANPNLERRMTVLQDTDSMFAPYGKGYDEKAARALFKLCLLSFV